MKKGFLFLCVAFTAALFHTTSVFGQKDANWWYFGFQVSVDFNSGTPVSVNNSAMNQFEGCSSISDPLTGSLLFYTDGQSIYTANHTLMPNGSGLTGEQSSAQSGLIVPMPGSSTEYYVFTAGEYFSSGIGGYQYSIVDLSLNGGLGDVTATKNVLLYSPACEKLCAVKNAAGNGYWVATHEFSGNNFVMYEVTAGGISAPHVVSVGTMYSSFQPIGYMKFSPDGTRLATVLSGQNMVEVYDFNASTGDVSNPITIGPVASNLYVYGISFSPNGQLLYVSEENSNFLSQFDLTAGSAAAITASKVTVGVTSQGAFQSLQLAPDGKLYCTNSGSSYLGVVNDPDIYGIGCNYVDQGFYLNGLTVAYGLPGFVESLFSPVVPPVAIFSAPNTICPGTCTDFTNLSLNATSFLWSFPGANPSVSVDANPTSICYNTPGNYSVQLIASNSFTSDTLMLNNYITVFPYPPAQGILQSGDTLFANPGALSYQWFHDGVIVQGATDYFYVAMESGNYNVVATDVNGCEVEAVIFDVIASVEIATGEIGVRIVPAVTENGFEIITPNATLLAVEIFNVAGQKVFTSSSRKVSCVNLARGLYVVEITTDRGPVRGRFINNK